MHLTSATPSISQGSRWGPPRCHCDARSGARRERSPTMSISIETPPETRRVERAIRYLARNRLRQPSLEDVADVMGLSPFHAQRVFSGWVGVSPKQFRGLLTVEHAK